jgi:hypothetical protein
MPAGFLVPNRIDCHSASGHATMTRQIEPQGTWTCYRHGKRAKPAIDFLLCI